MLEVVTNGIHAHTLASSRLQAFPSGTSNKIRHGLTEDVGSTATQEVLPTLDDLELCIGTVCLK